MVLSYVIGRIRILEILINWVFTRVGKVTTIVGFCAIVLVFLFL